MSEIIELLKKVEPKNLSLVMNAVNKADNLASDQTKKIRISFLRNVTIETIEPWLKFHTYKSGIKSECIFGDYDSIRQEILSQAYLLSEYNPEIIVLTLHYHVNDLFLQENPAQEIEQIFDLLRERTQALVLVNTLVTPFYASLNANDSQLAGVPHNYSSINQWIREYVLRYSAQFFLMDWERYIRLLGEDAAMDYRYWYMHRSPFKSSFLNLYAQDISKVVRALKGKTKKCLVLDCDNTLWGGIIGEDGLKGIKLDNQEYPGKMFYDFQQTLLCLHKRGVIIALCSKNNPDDVWNVLEKHPHCLLRKSHIAAARINWEDKASNILGLSKELNLGLDSFVFVDDSPMECDLVRSALPDVTVLSVPLELDRYPQLLLKEGWFDSLTLSQEDANRTTMYQQEYSRKQYAEKYENIEDYLRSLELKITILPVKKEDIARVAQLTQKTNQFNLSIKRYSEIDVEDFVESEDSVVFSMSAQDKFGNYGLTGVFIGRKQGSKGIVDSFLLSCRVLSRKIEYAFLSYCLEFLNQLWAISSWEANFVPAEKNNQIKKFLIEFGFTESNSNTHLYQIPVLAGYSDVDYIEIITG